MRQSSLSGLIHLKTQGSLPSQDAAVVLLFSLVVSGQMKLRRIDGWRKIVTVLSRHTAGGSMIFTRAALTESQSPP